MNKKIIFLTILLFLLFSSLILIFNIYDKNYKSTNLNEQTKEKTKQIISSLTTTKKESSMKKLKYNNIKYWLYEPDSNKKSLIIYLHNSKVIGDDLDLVLKNGLPKYLYDGDINVDGYVLIPQLKKGYNRWSSVNDELIELIDFIVNDYNIDISNISLTGHSIGGRETFELAIAYPDKFKKIAPVSANVDINDKNINALKNVLVWAFVGSKDTVVSPKISTNFINRLKKINDDARISSIDGADHLSILDDVYKNNELINWLLN